MAWAEAIIMIRKLGVLAAIIAAFSFLSPQPSKADVSPQTLAAAKTEGTILWYSALDTPTLNALVSLFNETHPGIVLKGLQIGSSALPARVMTERAAGKTNADVVSCDQFGFSQMAESDVFASFKPSDPGKFLKGTIDPK